ncbi:MAG: GEVED domain-containing protein, partial [Bacteroidota bacterium]
MTKILQFALGKYRLSILVFGLLFTQNAKSQCAFGNNQYPSATYAAPTTNGATTTVSTCSYQGEFGLVSGFLTTNIYTINFSISSYITVFNSSNVAVAYGPSPLSFTPPVNGTYKCQWNTPTGCGSQSGCQTSSVTLVGPAFPCSNPASAGTATSSPAGACPGQSINLGLTGNSAGTGLTYQWQSSTNGTTYNDIVGATAANYSLVQSVNTYYQCIVTCSSGTPVTSTPVQVNMNSFLNCYCNSASTYIYDEEIYNVTLGSLNNSSTCGSTGGPGSTINAYSDYTNSTPAVAIPNLTQGFSYPLSVEIGTCGGNYSNMTKVWIDYNQNGVFTDPGEEVYVSSTYTSGPHFETGTIVIPTTALTGNTRMRVINSETTSASGIT